MFPSSISPKPLLIATYLLLVYIGQVGYCILLVTARKPETKVRKPYAFLEFQLMFVIENHNQRRGDRFSARQLDNGVLGRCLGTLSFPHPVREHDF